MTRMGGSRGYAQQIAVRQVKMLGAALSRHTGQEEVEATRHLFLRLCLGFMRRNAALLMNDLMCAVCVRFDYLIHLEYNCCVLHFDH